MEYSTITIIATKAYSDKSVKTFLLLSTVCLDGNQQKTDFKKDGETQWTLLKEEQT